MEMMSPSSEPPGAGKLGGLLGHRESIVAALLGLAAGIANGIAEWFPAWVFVGVFVIGLLYWFLISAKLAESYK
jgi:hypothetical protein